VTWFLPMKKGCLGGIPKLWHLYLLDIFWGDAWESPSLSFCSFFNSSHHSPIPTLENFLHTKPFCFRFQPKTTTYKAYTTVATSPKVSWSKEHKKKVIKQQTQILAEIYQNRTADKGRIFEVFYVAQIKKCSTNESLDITWGICIRNRRSKIYTKNFHEFLRCSTKNSFRTTTSLNLTSLKLDASLGTKMK
jgi:hypothetical protein